jgi:hypothetical protein
MDLRRAVRTTACPHPGSTRGAQSRRFHGCAPQPDLFWSGAMSHSTRADSAAQFAFRPTNASAPAYLGIDFMGRVRSHQGRSARYPFIIGPLPFGCSMHRHDELNAGVCADDIEPGPHNSGRRRPEQGTGGRAQHCAILPHGKRERDWRQPVCSRLISSGPVRFRFGRCSRLRASPVPWYANGLVRCEMSARSGYSSPCEPFDGKQ